MILTKSLFLRYFETNFSRQRKRAITRLQCSYTQPGPSFDPDQVFLFSFLFKPLLAA